MKPNKISEALKLIMQKAVVLGGTTPEVNHLALAMLHTPEGREAIADHLDIDKDLLLRPYLPQLESKKPGQPDSFTWPLEIIKVFNPELEDYDIALSELQEFTHSPKKIRSTINRPENEIMLAIGLTGLIPRLAWLNSHHLSLEAEIMRLENATSSLKEKWPHLNHFYDKLGQLLKNQLRWKIMGHMEPVFYYSSRKDVAVLDQLGIELTGKKTVKVEEGKAAFDGIPKMLGRLEPGRLIVIRLTSFNQSANIRNALYEAMRKEAPEEIGEDSLFFQGLDGEVANALAYHYVIVQVIVDDNMQEFFGYPIEEFKIILEGKVEEEDESLFSNNTFSTDELKKFIRLSNSSNSITQAQPDLYHFFSMCMSLSIASFRELTEGKIAGELSNVGIIHLAARNILSHRMEHVMPETNVLMFRQLIREIIKKTEGLTQPPEVEIRSSVIPEDSLFTGGDGLISNYAGVFVECVRQDRVLAFSMHVDKETGRIIIDEPEHIRPATDLQKKLHTLEDVAGMEEVKALFNLMMLGLREPERFDALDISPFHNVLLYGPPGSGKTYLAKAFANEVNIPFHYLSSAEVNGQRYAGFGASHLRDFLNNASIKTPCIIFFDELDAFSNREKNVNGPVAYDAKSILNTLLTFMDGLDTNRKIIFIGATNRYQDLDEALIRDGRFGIQIEVKHLKRDKRADLIRMLLKPGQVESDYEQIVEVINANLPDGHPNSGVKGLIENMKRKAVAAGKSKVALSDVEAAIDEHLMGTYDVDLDPELRKALAFKLAAEAVSSKLLMPEQLLQRITLINRQKSFGRVVAVKTSEKEFTTAREVFVEMIVTYCSLLAERKKLGHNLLPVKPEADILVKLAKMLQQNFDLGDGEATAIHYSLRKLSSDVSGARLHNKLMDLLDMAKEAASNLLAEYWSEVEIIGGQLQRDGVADRKTLGIIPDLKLDPFSLISEPSFAF